ncbi:hypothetical protein [Lactococcus petauri]|uniref:hypothetical protein n=1 Tax=Lactococcus petauri TaxID=1940789 RepID=UPI0020C09A0A|nr:hypothetical protein [Lactococcus petauri]UQU61195.1 hypothetical protein lgb_01998 [Lactococcus petauri]WJE12795.1 hypothetical protein QR692_11800 [Lactococcus petauri]
MKKDKIEIDDIMKGLGVIANVMLIGQSIGNDCSDKSQMIQNYSSLCEMTEKYTQLLLDNANEVEINWRADNVDAQQFRKIQSVSKVG